jgi:hypothetical protein
MKSHRLILAGVASLFSGLLFTGCARTDYGNTSPKIQFLNSKNLCEYLPLF